MSIRQIPGLVGRPFNRAAIPGRPGGGGQFINGGAAAGSNNGLFGDLLGSEAGHKGSYGGHGGGFMGSDSCFSIDICPDLIFAAVAAAAAAGVYVIYQAIVTKGKRRRKRDSDNTWALLAYLPKIISVGQIFSSYFILYYNNYPWLI